MLSDACILSIRHREPGSARSLAGALELMRPDCVLIEAQSDAHAIIATAPRFIDLPHAAQLANGFGAPPQEDGRTFWMDQSLSREGRAL